MLNRATLWILAALPALSVLAQPQALAQAPSLPTLTTAADWDAMDLDPEVPSPASVLAHEIGERFTRHADMVRYFETLAEASDRVQLRTYGQSVQGRPLIIAVISSPENLARLDDITATNRELASGRRVGSRALQDQPAVAW